jgi:dienelactone hydrolase
MTAQRWPVNIASLAIGHAPVATRRYTGGLNMSSALVSMDVVARRRARPIAAARGRKRCAIVIGAVLALALSGHTGASAQTNSAPADQPTGKAFGPKQSGPWTVTGWHKSHGSYCTAERPLRGAAGRGATLQYFLLRSRVGYWLGLGSEDWELKSDASFPVELNANPVLHSDANAVTLGTNLAGIQLGSDRDLMRRLSSVPTIEVKTARTTFKLPVDAFDQAVTEIDACYTAIKQADNPFAASQPAAKPPATPAAAPAPKAAPANSRPDGPPPASPAGESRDTELKEERTFLTVRGKSSYRLEALVVRPAKAEGRLPVALITHGKNRKAEENQQANADLMLPQARDLAMRGWLAVAVMRRGYGRSDGLPGVSRGAAYMGCENGDLARGFEVEADDLDAALKVIAARPDADGARAIAIGQSFGGGAVLALAARQPAGLLGAVNVSGGAWRSDGEAACDHDALVTAMATLGARTRIVTLWLYAENDSLFPPALVNRMRDAYAKAGGRAELRMVQPILHDGHNLFADFKGRGWWLRALDGFLRAQVLPNANTARADRLMRVANAPAKMRPYVDSYLSAPTPKVLVVAANKGTYWHARPDDLDGARKQALANCREKSGAECTIAMENNDLVLPAGNDTNTASTGTP